MFYDRFKFLVIVSNKKKRLKISRTSFEEKTRAVVMLVSHKFLRQDVQSSIFHFVLDTVNNIEQCYLKTIFNA